MWWPGIEWPAICVTAVCCVVAWYRVARSGALSLTARWQKGIFHGERKKLPFYGQPVEGSCVNWRRRATSITNYSRWRVRQAYRHSPVTLYNHSSGPGTEPRSTRVGNLKPNLLQFWFCFTIEMTFCGRHLALRSPEWPPSERRGARSILSV